MRVVLHRGCLLLGIAVLAALGARGGASPPTRELAWSAQITNCVACHKLEPVLNHPVGVVPSMKIPAEFPLENGRLTCITCHRAEAIDHARTRSALHDGLLRETGQGDFCANCHQNSSARATHAFAIGRAHLGASPKTLGVAASNEHQSCISCHDGVIAPDASNHNPSDWSVRNQGHKVGMAYQERPSPNPNPIYLTPATTLDARIRLFGDQVTCGSCHSPFSQEKHLLVLPNQASRLCLSCHRI